VVSASSAHYGEVKTYATVLDIERYACCIDPANPAKTPLILSAADRKL
jgi:hypothetical protein